MKLRRANLWTVLVILALIIYAVISLILMQGKLTQAALTDAELEEQVTELEKSNAALQYAVDNPDDPEVIAGVARDKLDMVMPGEKVYQDPAAD